MPLTQKQQKKREKLANSKTDDEIWKRLDPLLHEMYREMLSNRDQQQ